MVRDPADRVTRVAEAAKQTTGEVLPRGGDKRSEDAQSIADSAIDLSQKDRAKENGISLDSQKKLDVVARERPDLHAQVKARADVAGDSELAGEIASADS